MAFVFKETATYEWPVTVEFPSGGKFEKQSFTAVFKKMPRSAFNELIEQGDDVLIGGIMDGWDEINDDDGNPISFNKKNLQKLFDDPYVLRATVSAYTESLLGAQAKN